MNWKIIPSKWCYSLDTKRTKWRQIRAFWWVALWLCNLRGCRLTDCKTLRSRKRPFWQRIQKSKIWQLVSLQILKQKDHVEPCWKSMVSDCLEPRGLGNGSCIGLATPSRKKAFYFIRRAFLVLRWEQVDTSFSNWVSTYWARYLSNIHIFENTLAYM